MSRRKQNAKRSKPSDLASLESTAKKLQSLLTLPEWHGFMRSGYARGIREKILKIDYTTCRNIIDRVPLLSAIINTRVEQVKKFSKYVKPSEAEVGYEFYPSDPTKESTEKDQKVYYQLASFLDQTGLKYDSTREDDFADYLELVTRETLSIDQLATEMQRNRKGDVIAFWMLDAGTIKRVDPREYNMNVSSGIAAGIHGDVQVKPSPDTRFCQMVDGKIVNFYSDDDLIFDYKNKRTDLRFRGWGYSPVEQCIDMITTLLFGYNYLRDQLMRDRVPKGFIQVMGDVGREQLDAIREYWYAAMSGAGGTWNIPIVPSGKDGVGIDWKSIQTSNRDMEYHKMMMFISSIVAAVFNIDLAELGIKADDSTSLIGETGEPRIKASKDRGLAGLLAFIEQHVNKILRKVNDQYKFRFVGIEKTDEKAAADLRKLEVETRMTVNELREADGLEPLKDNYANIVLNPQAVQLYNSEQAQKQQEKQQKQQGMGGAGGFGQPGQPGEEGNNGQQQDMGEPEEGGAEVDWSKLFSKSLTSRSGRKVRVIIE